MVSFGLDETYAEIPYDATTKERFEQRKAELPDEIPVVKYREPNGKYEYFVSPDGMDTSNGTIEKPFKTIERALEVAKVMSNENGIVIYLREGIYSYTDTLLIRNLVGNADNPIFISAYPGEDVKFIASHKLDNSKFAAVTDSAVLSRLDDNIEDKIRVIDLEEQGITSIPQMMGSSFGYALYMDSVSFDLARYPNIGYAKVEEVIDQGPITNDGEQDDGRGFTIGLVDDTEPLTWAKRDDIWVRGGFKYEWDQTYTTINIDYDNSCFDSNGTASRYGVKTGADFYYYNVFEELNFPGEYYIDRDSEPMKLYLYPIGDIIENSEIYFSVADDSLMQIQNCKNVIFSDISFENGTKEAVRILSSEDVVFQRCTFSNFGSNIAVMEKTKRSGFTSCKFVGFGDRAVRTNTSPNINNIVPFNNFIQNCAINGNKNQILHSMTSVGGVGEIASHNLYTNGYATGAGTGGFEGITEYNEIVGSPKYQLDSGGTYGGGANGMRAHHIRYNYIHDILPNSTNTVTRAIYLDEMASDNMVYGNIMYKVPAGIFSHGGRDNTFYNNITIALNSPTSFAAANSLNKFKPAPSDNLMSGTGHILPTEALRLRYPTYYKWLITQNEVYDEYYNSNGEYVRDEKWDEVYAPINFYYANNISALGGGKFIYENSTANDATEGLDTNFVIDSDPFVDSSNQNFNIKADSEIYTQIPNFEAPQFDKMGLLIGTDYMLQKPYLGEYGEIFAFSPANGDVGTHSKEKVEFMWTDVMWANRYRLEIATDKDFTNVVYDETTEYEYATVSLDLANQTYYWRVTATTLSKSVDSTPLKSKVFSFTTAN